MAKKKGKTAEKFKKLMGAGIKEGLSGKQAYARAAGIIEEDGGKPKREDLGAVSRIAKARGAALSKGSQRCM